MKKPVIATEENRRNLRKRLFAALSMLLVVVILAVMVSYAWIILSIAPEVKGIQTTVGANGSLEIALLSDRTFSDPNLVTTSVNTSLSQNVVFANESWGNLVDLNDPSYGLQEISLFPSRLNIIADPTGAGYRVDRNGSMLLVPTYGSDGRITHLTDKTVTGTFREDAFYHYADPDYGVRAIGTAVSLSVQSSALSLAKNNISTYTSSARNAAIASVDGVQDLLLKFAGDSGADTAFVREDLDLLDGMIKRLQTAEDYVEAALRQGLVAIAASAFSDSAEFESARSVILSSMPISAIVGSFSLPSAAFDFGLWVDRQEQMAADLQLAAVKLTALYQNLDRGEKVVKADVQEVLNYLMNLDQVLVNDKTFTEITRSDLMSLLGTDVNLALRPGSGVYADIADFAGNYTASVGNLAKIKTYSAVDPVYLVDLLDKIKMLTAADGGSLSETIKMQDLYGYALDLAFRCNANRSELLLKTVGSNRVYEGSDGSASMGGGSYMEFAINGDVDPEQLTALMDAVRVAFVGDDGALLGIAKLNVSNREVDLDSGHVMAPLYLYEFEMVTGGKNAGQLVMGQRRKTDNMITSMERNHAIAISTFVWLDGDIVDNSVVPISNHVSGTLNLQFASSADLLPADNNSLSNYEVDREGLNAMVADVYSNYIRYGRSRYTTVSWTNLVNVYQRAEDVSNDSLATENLIYNTQLSLENAVNDLQTMDGDFLTLAIESVRSMMGRTSDNARLLYKQDGNGNPILLTSYTQKQYDESTKHWIQSVDNAKNLRDEGHDLYTPIYTEESWNRLADALYYAEALRDHCNPTPEQEDNAYTRLQLAYDALDFCVYFTPYDYEGFLYYKASSDDTDTYGTWYYDDMTRVLSETTLLRLDAYAIPADFASIDLPEYVSHSDGTVSPYLHLNYGLNNQEIVGVYWEEPDGWVRTRTDGQSEWFASLYRTAVEADIAIPQSAQDVLYLWTDTDGMQIIRMKTDVSYTEAKSVIAELESVIEDEAVADETVPDPDVLMPMTDNQRLLLNKAISNARTISGYTDASVVDEKMVNLRNAVSVADALLVDPNATESSAATALVALNSAISHYDKELRVSEYNTIEYSIPTALCEFNLEYHLDDEYDCPTFVMDAEPGRYRFDVTLITSAGVLYRVDASTTVYNQASGVELNGGCDATTTVGAPLSLHGVELTDCNTTPPVSQTESFDRQIADTDAVSYMIFTVEDPDILEWTDGYDFVAKCPGKTKVYVTVKTHQGNTYVDCITVTVSEK